MFSNMKYSDRKTTFPHTTREVIRSYKPIKQKKQWGSNPQTPQLAGRPRTPPPKNMLLFF